MKNTVLLRAMSSSWETLYGNLPTQFHTFSLLHDHRRLVSFTNKLMVLLILYIFYRHELNIYIFSNTVTPELSFQAYYAIFHSFKTDTNVKICSRILRFSNVTNVRDSNISYEETRALATVMNHTVATADRCYDYKRQSNSVSTMISKFSA